jgi:MFS family permease
VRRERDLLRREREGQGVLPPWMGPIVVWRVLRQDPWYARFMLWMFVLGLGNIMAIPVLVIMLREEFNLSYFWSILISSTGALIVMPLAIPLWARVLDRAHVVRFRSIHSWTFVVASVIFFAGAVFHRVELMFLGQITMGIGYAGGTLAWNLGHVDFSPPSQTSQYMATHVTLNGVRGLIAPILAVGIYEGIKRLGGDNPGAWVFATSMVLSVVGAMGFVQLRRQMGKLAASVRRDH